MRYCESCGGKTYEETKYMNWLTLMNFINFLYYENYIEETTKEAMTIALMDFKPYAFEDAEDKT